MKTVKLGELAKIRTGKLDVNAAEDNGKYPFFTCASKIYKINSYAFDTEAILVAGNGDLNVKYYDGKFNAYQRTYVIDAIDKQKIDMKYLYYFMRKYIERLRNQSIGGIIKYIKLGHLTDAKIPLPPKDDQIRIATLLSRVEALIATRKNNLQQLDDFLKSTFLDMFGDPVRNEKGWNTDSLANNGTFKNGLNFGKSESGNKVRYVGVGDFGKLSKISDIQSLSLIELNKLPSEEYFLHDGDILLVRSNGNRELVGRCIVIYPKNEKVTFSGFCIRYRMQGNKFNPTYLAHLFRVPSFRRAMLKGGQGANIQNINQKILSSLKIPKPPIDLQNTFVEVVKNAELVKQRFEESQLELENLYAALSQKAFKGELDLSRLPLPEETTPKAHKVKHTDTVTATDQIKINEYSMSDPQARKDLLRNLFDTWLAEQHDQPLSLEAFWQHVYFQTGDRMDENSPPLGVEDYDYLKGRLFELVRDGKLEQAFVTNAGSPPDGQIELKAKG